MFTSNAEQLNARTGDDTMQLTTQATTIAQEVMTKVESKEIAEGTVLGSMQSHDAMDAMIEEHRPLTSDEYEWLKELDGGLVDRMIKSQQSKRSRSKSKSMTKGNYQTMLVGAIAENMLRLAHGKEKGGSGHSGTTTDIHFSDEALSLLAADQIELRKAIRNIQSRKSIMKSKANFDETSEKWQQILTAEEQLKGIRIGTVSGKTTQPIKDLLEGITDIESLKAADARELITKIAKSL
jgi:hypothetical protein